MLESGNQSRPTGGDNIFQELDASFAQEAPGASGPASADWWRLGSYASLGLAVVSGAVFAVFGADAWLKSASADSLPSFVQRGGFLCSRVDANAADALGDSDSPESCLPLADLGAEIDKKSGAVKASLSQALPLFLSRKLTADVLESSLAKFIASKGDASRIPYLKVIAGIQNAIAETVKAAGTAGMPDPVKCGGISFVQRTISFSCEVKGYSIMDSSRNLGRLSARLAALTFLEKLQAIDRVKMKELPRSLSSAESSGFSSTSVPVQLEYVLDANQL